MATSKRTPVTQDHELKAIVAVDYMVPGHAPRGVPSALFSQSKMALIERERGRCWVSGETAAQAGAPLEAHHYPVERCFAERWDWPRFSIDCQRGYWGPYAQSFDWVSFFVGATTITADDIGLPYLKVVDPYIFVDDMRVNGRLLSKKYHTGQDEGIHCLPEPIYLAQKYLAEGFKFSEIEVIHHEQEQTMTQEHKPVQDVDPETSPEPAAPEQPAHEDVGNGNPPPPPEK